MMIKLNHVKPGDIVHVEFLDHYSYTGANDIGVMSIDAYGKVTAVTKLTLEIGSWITGDMQHSHNNESFSILKSTVVGVRILK
jgi:hypothetical protein